MKKSNLKDLYKMYDGPLSWNQYKEFIHNYLYSSAEQMIKTNYCFELGPIGNIQIFEVKMKKSQIYYTANGEKNIKMKGSSIFKFKWTKSNSVGAWRFRRFKPYMDRYSYRVGKRGLSKYIKQLEEDKYSKNYSAVPAKN